MADRYWVGGTGTWNTTSTTNWSTTSGGAGGASVPTSADNVFFDQAGTYTVTTTGSLSCLNLTVSAGTVTFATGTAPALSCAGSFVLSAGTVWSTSASIYFSSNSSGNVVTTNGVFLTAVTSITFTGAGGGVWTLGSALTAINALITVDAGTFNTGGFNLTAAILMSTGSLARTINLSSSTVALGSNSTPLNFVNTLTLLAGTSQINLTGTPTGFTGGSLTFYNVAFTQSTAVFISGTNTFNNLSFTARTTTGPVAVVFGGDQTINGTFSIGAGTNAIMRTFVRSNTINVARTLTCAAVGALSDIDFRDITIAGAAAPVSGTRLGDCKGNSGITFPAPKTVYYRSAASANWGATTAVWSLTNGGTADINAFPLAQDTAVFPSSPTAYPSTGGTVTINSGWNIGSVDMSQRTAATMTLATSTNAPFIYGNWTNGSGTTMSGAGTLTFAGRGAQTLLSAGKAFTQTVVINTPGGSVTLQDAYTGTRNLTTMLTLTAGTFDANGYNVTLSGANAGFLGDGTNTRTLAVGSGTWTISGTGSVFDCDPSINLTVTGSGIVSLTSASAKTFAGGNAVFPFTLNQGGAGALTITGSNTFANITNTVRPTSVLFTAGTTTTFTSGFSLSGTAGSLVTISSATAAQHTLVDTSGTINVSYCNISYSNATGGATWNALTSNGNVDSGNNTGWIFTTGGAYTITALNGSYAATGYTAVISRDRALTAQQGSYTLTGRTATLSASRVLVTQNGTYAQSGQAVQVNIGRLISAENGVYFVSGQSAEITRGGGSIVGAQLVVKIRSFTERGRF